MLNKVLFCDEEWHSHHVLTSPLAVGEWSTSPHTKLYTVDKVPSTQGIEDCWARRHIFLKKQPTTYS
jgi:hypothetical protein